MKRHLLAVTMGRRPASSALTSKSPRPLRVFFNRVTAVCLLVTAIACHARKPATPVSEIVLAGDAHRDRILAGVYAGNTGWLWTAPAFSFALDPPASKPVFLELDFTVPDELSGKLPLTVAATVNGAEVARQVYPRSGRYLLAAQVPPQSLGRSPATVAFSADRTFPDPATSRPQSLIVVSVGLKEFEQTAPYREAELAKSRQAYEEVIRQRDLQIPPEKQKELMKLFHQLPIWESLSFHNVRLIKNPLDLWMLQQIAWEVRPDFVVETGTWFGGSALYWAHTLNGMGLENARVLTVDIQDLTKAASTHPLWKRYIQFYLGSSTDPKIVSDIARRVRNSRVIVNLDSDHSMHHVLEELRMYQSMVSPGSYIAVEDTHLDGVPTHPEEGPGPMAAVRQFLAEGGSKDFEQDFTREAMVMTSYPGGWLRRK